jgi:hypothetical protein
MNTYRISNKYNNLKSNNSWLVFTIFWVVILFQITQLKYIFGIETLARIVNLVSLLFLSVYAFYSVIFVSYSKKVLFLYLLPGIFIFCGISINICLNTSLNIKLINNFGLVIPWAIYLIVPFLIKQNKINSEILWKYFYYFMLSVITVSIVEYYIVFTHISYFRVITTPYGIFSKGFFSILHILEDGILYPRFYACFPEPGTLAMFLLPAIVFAFYNKKYIGLLVFLTALYFSNSLGGMVGLAMLVVMILFNTFYHKRAKIIYIFVLTIVLLSLWISYFEGCFSARYASKSFSRDVREGDVFNTIMNLPRLLINYPLGFKLHEVTETREESAMRIGHNFTPANYLRFGGIAAFFGYLACLFVSCWVSLYSLLWKNVSIEDKVVFFSIIILFPFIVQRGSIWDSGLFALLFAPAIIRFLKHG